MTDIATAWELLTTDEAKVLLDRRATHPDRYNNHGPGYGLKDGQRETRLLREPGPPRVRDFETHSSAGLTMSQAVEMDGFIGMGASGYGKPLVPTGPPRPPQHVYRVMSDAEFDQAKKRGFIQSDGRMNLADGEGTVCSLQSTGSFYAPGDGVGYRLVRIRYEDCDGWNIDLADGYVKTDREIPFDRVDLYSSPLRER